MSLIQISHLSFTHEGSFVPVFEDVSFSLDTDWKLGFTGRNGRGKTTFLQLLMGSYEYVGTISAAVKFEYFPYPVSDTGRDTQSVLEDIANGAPLWAIRRELSLLDVPEETLCRPFETLSSGERVKALLAALFLRENAFLLIDEPTNHLDLEGRRRVGAYLRGKQGFLLVSHDRAFLDSCVDHMLSINRSSIEIQKGNFSTWFRDKDRQDQSELRENETLRRDIDRLQEAAGRAAAWSDRVEGTKYHTRSSGLKPDKGYIGHQSAKMMKRAKSIEARKTSAAEEKSKLLKNIERAEPLCLKPLPYRKEPLITLRDVAVSYGGREVCKGVNLVIDQGDRVALCGKNGSGKTSILKLICGEAVPCSGTAYIGANLTISYVPQDASFLSGTLSAFAEEHRLDESLFKAILRKLDFSRAQFELPMERFSEGQKKKVLLAKSLCESAHLYVWDEPLNYIDVFSRMQIEELLRSAGSTVLFVEHDAAFVEKIAMKQVNLTGV